MPNRERKRAANEKELQKAAKKCNSLTGYFCFKKEMLTVQNFINGEFVKNNSNNWINSFDPSTGKVHAWLPSSTKEDVDLAVNAARNAFQKWSRQTPKFRSNILLKVADLVESRMVEFAEAESKDQGKPVWLAKLIDVPRLIHNFRFFATAILHRMEESTAVPELSIINYTVSSPAGIAGIITPWNLPAYLLSFKIAPALAAGCSVVAKPSEFTSVTACMLCSVFKEAGVPPGVVNMVFGTGSVAGSAIVSHPDVNVISFTGSVAVGAVIREATAAHPKKLSLELGGKNAAIIFPDVDLDSCLDTTVRSGFTNQGEVCLCTSRVFIHKELYEVFCNRYVALVRNLHVGPPRDEKTKVGALVSKDHMEKVLKYIKFAIEDGGTILCGEGIDGPLDLPPENKEGYFVRPTVIVGLEDTSRCMQEEIFGPVVCISSFSTEEEVIKRANNVKYGLCASVWSTNASTLHRVAPLLEVGTIWCNCWLLRDLRMPFGGLKLSGTGREDQRNSLDFYTEKKTIAIKI